MTKAKPDKAGTSAVPPKSGSALQKLMAFVATRDPIRARAFYRDTLGLELVSGDPQQNQSRYCVRFGWSYSTETSCKESHQCLS